MNARALLVVPSLVVFLAACAGSIHVRSSRPGADEGPHLTVPYFSDRREQWGPAALADVLSFWGRPAELKALRREIRFLEQPEAVALDVKSAARSRGLEAEMAEGDLTTVKRELDAGRPVLVLVNIGFGWLPVRAYMVVVGYNDFLEGVYVHWGPNRDHFLSYRQFEADWTKTGRWLVRVSGPEAAAKIEPVPVVAAPPAAIVCPTPPIVKRRRPPPTCVPDRE